MGIKCTHEEVKLSFEKEGYVLVSTEYVNRDTKLEYICPKGHCHSISYHNWKYGQRCGKCATNVKFTVDEVRAYIESIGYTLIDDSYVKCSVKLNYTCGNGHTHSMTLNDLRSGHRCPYCQNLNKKTIIEVKGSFENEGYTLLSTEYISNKTKLKYMCDKGHISSILYGDWVNGVRCSKCRGVDRLDIDYVRKLIEIEGYALLTEVYSNNHTLIDIMCDKGHLYQGTIVGWSSGNRCPYCAGKAKLTVYSISKELERYGYKLLSDAYIPYSKIKYSCPIGHEHEMTMSNWARGNRCPTCANINRSGANNINWSNGISFEQYCAAWQDKEYKYEIRERDGHKCLNPYCASKDPTKLVIHHVNYDKQDCHFKNLITVCNSCNSKANHDRDWHQSWYQALLHNRYGYIYKQQND